MTDLFGNEEPVKTAKPTVYKNKTVQNQPSSNIHQLKSKTEIVPAMFEDNPIRRTVDNGTVFYSIVDVVSAITGSTTPRKLWVWTKNEIITDGLQLSNITRRLKLKASDGKMRLTDCADQAGIILIIEYLHSPKAAPFRVWFSHLASERLEEIENPSKGIDNAVKRWKEMGKSEEWIAWRLKGKISRKSETDTLQAHGITKPVDFAHFTDRTNKAVYGATAEEVKENRGLAKTDSLRDNSSALELRFLDLHELGCSMGIEQRKAYGRSQIDGVYDVVDGIVENTKQAFIDAFGAKAVTSLIGKD